MVDEARAGSFPDFTRHAVLAGSSYGTRPSLYSHSVSGQTHEPDLPTYLNDIGALHLVTVIFVDITTHSPCSQTQGHSDHCTIPSC